MQAISTRKMTAGDDLFDCGRCFDTGFWLTPRRELEDCPTYLLCTDHAKRNGAGRSVLRAYYRLFGQGEPFTREALEVAQILTNYSSGAPCEREYLTDRLYGLTNLSGSYRLRKFHAIIEELRKGWLLPVGSRKSEPSGYWIITDIEDYRTWFESVKSAPITQLSTIHRNAKHNFPLLAEQMEFEFWNDLGEGDGDVG